MNNTITLTKAAIQLKIQNLDNQIESLKEERRVNEYLLNEYFNATQPPVNLFNFTEVRLDANKTTKSLIVDILKKTKSKMNLKQVQEAFLKIKPGISPHTIRVALYEVGRKEKYPVRRQNGKYWYEE